MAIRKSICVLSVTLALVVTISAGRLHAQERGKNSTGVVVAASGSPKNQVVPYGVPLAPPIYFVNFLFLYILNPATAALMPAYKAPLPQQVYKCLLENPDGCPYEKMVRFFRKQANAKKVNRKGDAVWPSSCQTTEQWQPLAPPEYQHPVQINEPLGQERADQLAQALGIQKDMILTDTEYQCVMGVPPRDPTQKILYSCFINFTASKGNEIVVPFSSYGLNLNEHGKVLSLCAPHAPCLDANAVFLELPEIAEKCNFTSKLDSLLTQTPVLEFIEQGGECQAAWKPSCIAEATRSE
jgi:hypothetical protein